MESLTNTLHQITEGLTAPNEQAILPIYYGDELANGAAYTAYRFKRFAEAAGHLTVEVAHKTPHATAQAVEAIGHYLTYMANA